MTAAVQRIIGRYVDGTLDAAAVRRLLAAARPASDDPVAPLVATALKLLSDPITETRRRELLLAELIGSHRDH